MQLWRLPRPGPGPGTNLWADSASSLHIGNHVGMISGRTTRIGLPQLGYKLQASGPDSVRKTELPQSAAQQGGRPLLGKWSVHNAPSSEATALTARVRTFVGIGAANSHGNASQAGAQPVSSSTTTMTRQQSPSVSNSHGMASSSADTYYCRSPGPAFSSADLYGGSSDALSPSHSIQHLQPGAHGPSAYSSMDEGDLGSHYGGYGTGSTTDGAGGRAAVGAAKSHYEVRGRLQTHCTAIKPFMSRTA
jgi:hypothetical protein